MRAWAASEVPEEKANLGGACPGAVVGAKRVLAGGDGGLLLEQEAGVLEVPDVCD